MPRGRARGRLTAAITDLVTFSRSMEDQLRGTRVAVAAEQPVVFGFARMYQLMRNPPYELRVFRSPLEAEAWLKGGENPSAE